MPDSRLSFQVLQNAPMTRRPARSQGTEVANRRHAAGCQLRRRGERGRLERQNDLRRRTQEQVSFSKPPAAAWLSTTTITTTGWIFSWSTAGGWKVSPNGDKSRTAICSRTIATERSPMSPQGPGSARTGWGQACCVGDYNNDG